MKQKPSGENANKKKTLSRIPVTIRLPEEVIQRIDRELDGRDIPLSRNNWLLEAAIEKLRRNGSGERHGA
jgi:hypothetical protein